MQKELFNSIKHNINIVLTRICGYFFGYLFVCSIPLANTGPSVLIFPRPTDLQVNLPSSKHLRRNILYLQKKYKMSGYFHTKAQFQNDIFVSKIYRHRGWNPQEKFARLKAETYIFISGAFIAKVFVSLICPSDGGIPSRPRVAPSPELR
jgi:hypothetical protein